MSKSIITNEKECFICMNTLDLHKHHIFYGYANRKISERDGCWVYLCPRHHNMSNEGVHMNKPFDIMLKKYCQEKWEAKNGDRKEFIRTFGQSYL
jgi:hypothetical protein